MSSGTAERTAVTTRRAPTAPQQRPTGSWFAELGAREFAATAG